MFDVFRALYRDDRGATALEYGLLVALISMASVMSLKAVGLKIGNVLANAGSALP